MRLRISNSLRIHHDMYDMYVKNSSRISSEDFELLEDSPRMAIWSFEGIGVFHV